MKLFKLGGLPQNLLGNIKLPGEAFRVPIHADIECMFGALWEGEYEWTYQGILAGGGTRSPSNIASLNSGTYVSAIVVFSVCAVLGDILRVSVFNSETAIIRPAHILLPATRKVVGSPLFSASINAHHSESSVIMFWAL